MGTAAGGDGQRDLKSTRCKAVYTGSIPTIVYDLALIARSARARTR